MRLFALQWNGRVLSYIIGKDRIIRQKIKINTQENYSYIPWKSIKGMRNKIFYDYENIDFAVLWGTITKSLPITFNSNQRSFISRNRGSQHFK